MLYQVSGETPDRANEPSAETIGRWDSRHWLHPWQPMDAEGAPREIVARAEGIHLYDPEGRRYIDGPGGMWCMQLGYGRAEIGAAMAEQASAVAYNSPWTFTSEPSAMLARAVAERAPGDLNTVFFTTGGSTAVDSALRFSHFYNNLLGRPEKKLILAREKGYHGSTYLAATVSGKERDKSALDTAGALVHILPNVNPHIRPEGMSVDDWCDAKVADLEHAIAEIGADRIAAFIAEPVLASGGVIVPAPGYHKRTWELCRQHDILYISDEVVTGFGRLGHWFASEAVFDIVPDIITCAKGLTSGYAALGAMIVSDRLLDQIRTDENNQVLFANGYTYSGHPISCAAALKSIEIFEREGVLAHVRTVAPRFQERLAAMARFRIIGDARGLGLLGCLEGTAAPDLPEAKRLAIDKEFGARIDAACDARGLIVRPLINMCVFSPPLIITPAQIDEMFDILEDAVAEVEREML